MKTLALILTLVFNFAVSANIVPAADPRYLDFKHLNCLQNLQPPAVAMQQFVADYPNIFENMLQRLEKTKPAISRAEAEDAFFQIVVLFTNLGPALNHSQRIPSSVLPMFLAGVAIWVYEGKDLENIWSQLHRNTNIYRTKTEDFISVEYFVSRMVWLASRYEELQMQQEAEDMETDPTEAANPVSASLEELPVFEDDSYLRRNALIALDSFDELYSTQLRLHWNRSRFSVCQSEPGDMQYDRLQRMGVHFWDPNFGPKSLQHIQLNGGRLSELSDISASDLWFARHLAKVSPNEKFVGFGDKGVRIFFPFIRIIDGRITMFGRSADFATLIPYARSPHGMGINLYEMKFSSPNTHTIDMDKAHLQLEDSFRGVVDGSIQPDVSRPGILTADIPVLDTQVVIPRRQVTHWRDLGGRYRIGRRLRMEANASIDEVELKNSSGKWEPVILTARDRNGVVQSRTLTIRQIPITSEHYDQIKAKLED